MADPRFGDVDADADLGDGIRYEEPGEWGNGGFAPPHPFYGYRQPEQPILSDHAARNFQTVFVILALALILRALRR